MYLGVKLHKIQQLCRCSITSCPNILEMEIKRHKCKFVRESGTKAGRCNNLLNLNLIADLCGLS